MTAASPEDVPLLKSHDLELLGDHMCNAVLEGPATATRVTRGLVTRGIRSRILTFRDDRKIRPVTPQPHSRQSAPPTSATQGISYKSYTLYRKAHEYRHSHEDRLEITNIFYNKEEVQTVRLHGSECQHCGTRHFPMVRVCARCEEDDQLTQVALQRTGKIFTYAADHLAASPFPPTVMAVVDLDGGGRIYCEVVDAEVEFVEIGLSVELVMRRLREGGGLYHYYWKCRPRRSA